MSDEKLGREETAAYIRADDHVADVNRASAEAFTRGAERMREACVAWVEENGKDNRGIVHPIDLKVAASLRSLPLPTVEGGRKVCDCESDHGEDGLCYGGCERAECPCTEEAPKSGPAPSACCRAAVEEMRGALEACLEAIEGVYDPDEHSKDCGRGCWKCEHMASALKLGRSALSTVSGTK